MVLEVEPFTRGQQHTVDIQFKEEKKLNCHIIVSLSNKLTLNNVITK